MSKEDIEKYEPVMDEKKAKKFGRPPKYSDKILEEAYEYLIGGWKEVGQALPSKVGLALYLGVVSSTVDNWCADEDKEDFLGICKAVMDMQHSCLLNNGLTGAFTAPITKMILTKHGYSDKVETSHTNDGKPFEGKPPTIDTSKLDVDQLKALKEAMTPDED